MHIEPPSVFVLPRGVLLVDSQATSWVIVAICALGAGCAVAYALSPNADENGRMTASVFAIVLAFGAWSRGRRRALEVRFNCSERRIEHCSSGALSNSRVRSIPFDDVGRLFLRVEKSEEGIETYFPGIRLKDGTSLPLVLHAGRTPRRQMLEDICTKTGLRQA